MEVNQECNETKLKATYKFITSDGWTFKWINSMALTFVTSYQTKGPQGIIVSRNNNSKQEGATWEVGAFSPQINP